MTDVAVKYLPDLIVLVFAFLMILFGTGSVYLNMERNKRVDKYVPTFIFLLMCLIFCVLNMGCTNHPSGAIVLDNVIPVPDQPVSYNLVDFGGTSHRYRENIFDFNLPKDNPKLTQYCSIHYDWEKIVVRWTKDGIEYLIYKQYP